MRIDSDWLQRIHQILTLTVGTLVIGAMGIACCLYGPGVAASIREFYRPMSHAEGQEAIAKSMMQHVSPAKFEMNEEARRAFEAQQAEFAANRKLGETYRMPPPRRP